MGKWNPYKKKAQENDEKIIMRDKIWNYLQDCNLWEELDEGKPTLITKEGLKDMADDIVDRIHE